MKQMTTQSQKTSVSLPYDLLIQIKKMADDDGESVSAVIEQATRYYLMIHQWEKLQKKTAIFARKKNITTEDDVNRIVHESRR